MKKRTSTNYIFALGGLFVLLVALTLSVDLVQKNQDLGSQAAGKGRGGNKATLTLNQANPTFASAVTFTSSSDYTNDWVNVRCSQSGAVVYAQWREVINFTAETFSLGPTPSWTGGAASCVADLVLMGNNNRTITTTTFNVSP